jgi:iron complex transport system substrate-binding protein
VPGRRRIVLALALSALAALSAPSMRAAAPPARIVSTSPSITETLFALGLGDRVVGVSEYCRFPPAAQKLPKVGSFLKPNVESIARLLPDLTFVHSASDDVAPSLDALHLRYVVVDRSTTSSVFSAIRQIGGAAGVPDRAEALVRRLEDGLAAVRARAAGRPRRRVLFIIGRRAGTLADLVAVGRDEYLNDLIELAGGINVMASDGVPAYPRISMETVIRLDPDVILDTVDMGDTDADRSARVAINHRLWLAYPLLSAVRTDRVHNATIDPLVVPGPRIVEAAEWLAARISADHAR